ncbi:YjgN family protein [Chenggangzhangella methanolivorans]|uniref:DUF898 domain-containing protein n=1 Tax=Chenggangzhangella methanolivorans TaxID=1437009 RepID=A0A9E6R8Y1_9HYPH|nr:YjgN family protein [Chenggangzhangella methanolivorans]QZO00254.1 DUF898 domain-containing protein [Chenggangzhangella methanolivorans]
MTAWNADQGETGVRPSFQGSAGEMFPIVFKGLALTVLTLGVYRFWYLTNVRRFLWNRVEVGGDYLEYTGRGVELFIGFLIALAVVIPLYGVIFFLSFLLGPIGTIVFQNVATVAIIFLAQFALFRARRYRLTRTIWRGVRFQQTGSGLAYAAKSLGWAILVILTLGLVYPWMRASLERYKMTNTWYGDQQGAFSSTGGQLFKRGFLLWLLCVVVIVGPIAVLAALEMRTPGAAQASPAHAALFVLFLLLPVVFAVYLAIEYRWWANGCSIGPAAASCDLGLFQFFKVYAGYFGVVLLFSMAVGAVGGLIAYLLHANGVLQATEPGPAQYAVMAGGVLVYFVIALAFAALWQLFGVRPIWRKSFESVEIFGLPALMAAQSQAPVANAFGEGIADAIDFGGF